MDMRVNDPNLQLVANIGADWWRNASAGYVNGFGNNPGAGMSNWVGLSTQWSTLRLYSWITSQLRADPPPQLAGSTPETIPTVIRGPQTLQRLAYPGRTTDGVDDTPGCLLAAKYKLAEPNDIAL
jgi:hypothetical protein